MTQYFPLICVLAKNTWHKSTKFDHHHRHKIDTDFPLICGLAPKTRHKSSKNGHRISPYMRIGPKNLTRIAKNMIMKMSLVFPLYAKCGQKVYQNCPKLTKWSSSWIWDAGKIANKFWKGCFARFFSFTTSHRKFMRIWPLWPRDCCFLGQIVAWEGSTHFGWVQKRREDGINF